MQKNKTNVNKKKLLYQFRIDTNNTVNKPKNFILSSDNILSAWFPQFEKALISFKVMMQAKQIQSHKATVKLTVKIKP